MTQEQFIVELLKAILSTPTAIAAVSITFMILFKKELKALIERIRSVEFPGGSVTASQAQMSATAATIEVPSNPALQTEGTQLPSDVKLSPDDQKRMAELFEAETARAAFWEYQFLNRFLVFNTQRVLDWLAGLPQRTTMQMYDAFWTPLIQDSMERQAIISALQNHHLISITGALIEVTPKGREYLQARGALNH